MKRIPIVIDTDIGSDIDDTWALAYALRRPVFDVKAICVTGRLTEYRAALVAQLLKRLGREVPVIRGIDSHGETIVPQARWLEGAAPALSDLSLLESILSQTPDLHVVGLAPNSTLAAIGETLERTRTPVVAMAGSVYKGYFDADTPVPECNIVTDLAASRELYRRRLDYCMIPLDACGMIRMTGESYQSVRNGQSAAARAVMENYRIWDEDYEGGARKYDWKESSTILYDLAPLWYLEFPQYFKEENLTVSVTEHGITAVDGGGMPMKVTTALVGQEELLHITARTLLSEE